MNGAGLGSHSARGDETRQHGVSIRTRFCARVCQIDACVSITSPMQDGVEQAAARYASQHCSAGDSSSQANGCPDTALFAGHICGDGPEWEVIFLTSTSSLSFPYSSRCRSQDKCGTIPWVFRILWTAPTGFFCTSQGLPTLFDC